MAVFDTAIVGGGIVGLSVARALLERQPKTRLLVLEKEASWAAHQTGRNSGVIHSGIYYRPGSLKAKLSIRGNARLVEFCRAHEIPCDVCGKVIVATHEAERPLLERLYERGLENGLKITRLSRDQVREIEPHVECLEGISVPSTGIVDFAAVCRQWVAEIEAGGGILTLECRVNQILPGETVTVLETSKGSYEAKQVINCAGLHSDRVTRSAGMKPPAKIVPFRGEYYELRHERRHLVRHLIYPVPNPDFPFLGVHFTRMIDGSIHAGPNAVLSFKREGYRWSQINPFDLAETLLYPGFWKLIARHGKEGMKEMYRSLSKAAFVRSLQQLIPEIQSHDLVPSEAGVRAQALKPDGALVDDFLFVSGRRMLHVCNAPSPAATASLEIADAIVDRLSQS